MKKIIILVVFMLFSKIILADDELLVDIALPIESGKQLRVNTSPGNDGGKDSDYHNNDNSLDLQTLGGKALPFTVLAVKAGKVFRTQSAACYVDEQGVEKDMCSYSKSCESGYKSAFAKYDSKGKAAAVYVKHNDGSCAYYLHFRCNSPLPLVNSEIEKGDVIGIAGTTGSSTGIHLHLGIGKFVAGNCITKMNDGLKEDNITLQGEKFSNIKTGDIPVSKNYRNYKVTLGEFKPTSQNPISEPIDSFNAGSIIVNVKSQQDKESEIKKIKVVSFTTTIDFEGVQPLKNKLDVGYFLSSEDSYSHEITVDNVSIPGNVISTMQLKIETQLERINEDGKVISSFSDIQFVSNIYNIETDKRSVIIDGSEFNYIDGDKSCFKNGNYFSVPCKENTSVFYYGKPKDNKKLNGLYDISIKLSDNNNTSPSPISFVLFTSKKSKKGRDVIRVDTKKEVIPLKHSRWIHIGAREVVSGEDGQVTFRMDLPGANSLNYRASIEKIIYKFVNRKGDFKDITGNEWFYSILSCLSHSKLQLVSYEDPSINENAKFDPMKELNRGEALAMAIQAYNYINDAKYIEGYEWGRLETRNDIEDLMEKNGGEKFFQDIGYKNRYFGYMRFAKEHCMVKGYANYNGESPKNENIKCDINDSESVSEFLRTKRYFLPAAKIKRSEVLSLLTGVFNLPVNNVNDHDKKEALEVFSEDVSENDYFYINNTVPWFYKEGLIRFSKENKFSPNRNITKAEMFALLLRIHDKKKNIRFCPIEKEVGGYNE